MRRHHTGELGKTGLRGWHAPQSHRPAEPELGNASGGRSGTIAHIGQVVVFTGGEIHTTPTVGPDDIVLAADSGYDHALAAGVPVDRLVGDLDSISSAGLDHARSTGVQIDQHPIDKDETDLELAMRLAIEGGASAIAIYGGEGGRIAHLLTVALSQSNALWATTDVVWHTHTGVIRTATPGHAVTFACDAKDSVTLVPIGQAVGVSTHGLRWALDNASLERGSSMGVSNEATTTEVRVEVTDGAVLVIHEGVPAE